MILLQALLEQSVGNPEDLDMPDHSLTEERHVESNQVLQYSSACLKAWVRKIPGVANSPATNEHQGPFRLGRVSHGHRC